MLLNNEKLKQSLAAYSHIFAVLALGASTQSLSFTFYAWATAVFVCLSLLLLIAKVLLVFTTASKGCYYSISILGIKHKQHAYLHSKGFTVEPDTDLQNKWRLVVANQRYLLNSRSYADSLALMLGLWFNTNAFIKEHSGAKQVLITK